VQAAVARMGSGCDLFVQQTTTSMDGVGRA
jgi:hypothetical protein